MLAARDQENLVHGHQTAAAAKPLNQGVKQLPPKTPRNRTAKTPLKIPLKDENGPVEAGEGKNKGGRGNENGHWTNMVVKGGFGDRNAFITPMGTPISTFLAFSSLSSLH